MIVFVPGHAVHPTRDVSNVVSDVHLSDDERAQFHETLWEYYHEHGRHDLPWRQPEADSTFDPYKIMVSELMLQQTQVSRVLPKYVAFLEHFPTTASLGEAELGDVLRMWQGLGYNRRAKFLWQAAQAVQTKGIFPNTRAELVTLPGVGVNTAGAILAYVRNEPVLFIETNVRTVYIHHFFHEEVAIDDRAITELLAETLDQEHVREFYWALMDYGSNLKVTMGNLSRSSKQYVKQSPFAGSRRQVRGLVLRLLSEGPRSQTELQELITDERLESVLADLVAEELVHTRGGVYVV